MPVLMPGPDDERGAAAVALEELLQAEHRRRHDRRDDPGVDAAPREAFEVEQRLAAAPRTRRTVRCATVWIRQWRRELLDRETRRARCSCCPHRRRAASSSACDGSSPRRCRSRLAHIYAGNVYQLLFRSSLARAPARCVRRIRRAARSRSARHFDDMYIASDPARSEAVDRSRRSRTGRRANGERERRRRRSTRPSTQLRPRATTIEGDAARRSTPRSSNKKSRRRVGRHEPHQPGDEGSQHRAGSRRRPPRRASHYIEAYVRYLRRYVRCTQENMYFREAQYENSRRRRSASSNNIAPKGVTYDCVPEADGRSRSTARRRRRSNVRGRRRPRTDTQRDNWLKIQTAGRHARTATRAS